MKLINFIQSLLDEWRTARALEDLDSVHSCIALDKGYEEWERTTKDFYLQRRKEIIERKGQTTGEDREFMNSIPIAK